MANNIRDLDLKISQIVNILDRNDNKNNKANGFIEADEWKRFVQSDNFVKGKGNLVSFRIQNKDAKNSIISYLSKQTKTEQEKIDLAQRWLDKLTEEADKKFQNNLKNQNIETKLSKTAEPLKPIEPSESMNIVPPVVNFNLIESVLQQNQELIEQLSIDRFIENPEKQKEKITGLMQNEIQRRNDPYIDVNKIDFEYWSEKIYNVSKYYKVQPALLIAIMAQETLGKFDKNVDCSSGHGIMGITIGTAGDILKYRTKAFLAVDQELAEDILYLKDENGNIMTDKNGEPTKRYKNPDDLLKACVNDEELCLKVGLLVFEMKFMHQIVRKKSKISKKDQSTIAFNKQIEMTKEQFASGEIKLSQTEIINYMDIAAEKYNNCTSPYTKGPNKGRIVKDVYHEQVTDSLKYNNYDYSQILIKL